MILCYVFFRKGEIIITFRKIGNKVEVIIEDNG